MSPTAAKSTTATNFRIKVMAKAINQGVERVLFVEYAYQMWSLSIMVHKPLPTLRFFHWKTERVTDSQRKKMYICSRIPFSFLCYQSSSETHGLSHLRLKFKRKLNHERPWVSDNGYMYQYQYWPTEQLRALSNVFVCHLILSQTITKINKWFNITILNRNMRLLRFTLTLHLLGITYK